MRLLELPVLAALVRGGFAATVYITDLPIYSQLAPCATGAVANVVQGLTQEVCPVSVTQLASCACSQDQNSASIVSKLSASVIEYCGSTAAADVSSADVVFSAYCNQATPVAVASPSAGAVSQYITQLPAYSYLAPCAQGGLANVVQGLTNEHCPSGYSALESCACTKDQNSLQASENINSAISEYCGSTHTQDVSSAQAVFAGYCGLANGTSSFPAPGTLSGDVTYYITDLPIYSSMATCAQYAVANPVQAQTDGDCPSDPKLLVSCACAKDQNSQAISSSILSEVSEQCGSTASADMSSAISVFNYYCSAGQGLVTPAGVLASATTLSPGGAASTNNANATPTNTGSSSGSSTGSTSTNPLGLTKSGVHVATIAGIAVGVVVFLLVLFSCGCRIYRRRARDRRLQALSLPGGEPGAQPAFQLDGDSAYRPPEYIKSELPVNTPRNPVWEPPKPQPEPVVTYVPNPIQPVSPRNPNPNPYQPNPVSPRNPNPQPNGFVAELSPEEKDRRRREEADRKLEIMSRRPATPSAADLGHDSRNPKPFESYEMQ